ncbi:MAG: zinc ribbon domain-containing protein [Desulfitobacteriaceae bacterium]
MALFDKISKIAKSVGDEAVSAAKKSGELFEITKLNHAISDEEEKIKVIFTKIGSLCYQKFQVEEVVDPDLLHHCKKIEEIQSNIAIIKQKILEIRSIKVCQSCGNELALDITFCPTCGSKQSTEETTPVEETKVCPECSVQVVSDAAFCTSCGTKM